MSSSVRSVMVSGSEGLAIDVECHLSNGLPSIIIVGLGSKAVDEAKERLRSAFASAGIKLPRQRITINLAPADIPKESSSYDLAMAAAIMEAAGPVARQLTPSEAVIGEVGLDGSVKPVRGIIGKLIAGKRLGITAFYVPVGNADQAELIPDITITPIATTGDLYAVLSGTSPVRQDRRQSTARMPAANSPSGQAFASIAGQEQAKRALIIAAAGGHNVLLSGPPGTGKSMLARSLITLLPPLSQPEMLEVTHLHSLANKAFDRLVSERPFRAPHHTSSYTSVAGGGTEARPGEVTLSHRGILLMDEIPEFDRRILEALRQPLEDKVITVGRAKATVEYPADFLLVATANPCPCGYFGSSRPCQCSPYQLARYRRRLSGPILDRIDLFVTVDNVDHALLLRRTDDSKQESAGAIRNEIAAARNIQYGRTPDRLNCRLTNEDIAKHSLVSNEAVRILIEGARRLDLSPRAYMRTLKVARTIADLEKSPAVESRHVSEALQYRFAPELSANC